MNDEFGGVLIEEESPSHDEFGGVFVNTQPKQAPPPPIQAQRRMPIPAPMQGQAAPPRGRINYNPFSSYFTGLKNVGVGAYKTLVRPPPPPGTPKPPHQRGFIPDIPRLIGYAAGTSPVAEMAQTIAESGGEAKKSAKDFLVKATTPLVNVPESAFEVALTAIPNLTHLVPATEEGKSAFRKGAAQSVKEGLVDFMASPAGVSTLAIGGLPKMAQSAVSLAFSGMLAANLPHRYYSLKDAIKSGNVTDITREVASAVTELGMTALAGAHGVRGAIQGFRGVKQRLDVPRAGELPPILRPIQPPPLPEGVQRAVPVRETAKVPVVETPRVGEKVGERVLTPEELAAKEKAVVKEAEALTPEQTKAVERQRLQAELEGKPVEAPIEKPKVEVSEVQQIAEIRHRVKKANKGQPGPILERLIKKEIEKVMGKKAAEAPAAKEAIPTLSELVKTYRTAGADHSTALRMAQDKLASLQGKAPVKPGEIATRDVPPEIPEAPAEAVKFAESMLPEGATPKEIHAKWVDAAARNKMGITEYALSIGEKLKGRTEDIAQLNTWAEQTGNRIRADIKKLPFEDQTKFSSIAQLADEIAQGAVGTRPNVKRYLSRPVAQKPKPPAIAEEGKTTERKFFEDLNAAKERLRKENPAASEEYINTMAMEEVRPAVQKPTPQRELQETLEPPAEPGGVGEPPKPPAQPPPLPPKGAPESLPSAITKEPASDANFRMRDAIPAAFRYFSEGMVERVARSGGEHSKAAAPLLNRVVSNQKGHYGSLTDVLDPALEAAGKMNKATKWANGFDKVTDGAAIARAPEAIEGKIPVPDFAKPTIELAKKSNLRTGQMYEPVTEGYKATGAAQRNLTAFGFDLIRRGKGNVWDRYAEGTAKANNKSVAEVKGRLEEIKRTYDEPSPNVASIERVNQDFQRDFPRAVTHVKVNTYLGPKWEPVLHSQLYSYLEASARRASHVRSFREAFRTPEDLDTMTRNVRSELDPSHQKDFDALIRGLQGHPSDNYGGMTILSPDQPPAATLKLFNQTVGNLMAKFVLSGQMMTQAGETAVGATPIFLGAPRYLKAMAKQRQLYTELERAGSVNRVIYDMSSDPTRPILSKFRQAGNIISKGTAQQYLNELQEGLAAATARFVREDIMAGRLSKWDKAMLPLTFEKMGFTKAQAADMIQGKQPHLLAEFERKAAAWMTSGNKAIAEGSRLGASRLFNSIFRFQSYAMARSNQLRKVWGGVTKAAQEVAANPSKENAARLWNESRQFARFHTGATIQGALTSAVFALFYGGPSGLKILYNEAKDEPDKFLMESFMAATSGPLYLVMRGKEYGGLGGIGEQFIRSMFPYQIMRNFIDMAQGAGSYRDTLPKDRVGKFVQQKIPASRALSTGLSMVGLGWENKPLENSIKGFYRWRRDEMGKSTFKDETEAYKKRAYFRTHMRKAVNALKTGDIDAVKASIAKAAQSPDLKPNSIVSSLNARKILKNPNLRDLGPEELDKLRKRIGPEAVERLQQFDAMIDALIEMYQ